VFQEQLVWTQQLTAGHESKITTLTASVQELQSEKRELITQLDLQLASSAQLSKEYSFCILFSP